MSLDSYTSHIKQIIYEEISYYNNELAYFNIDQLNKLPFFLLYYSYLTIKLNYLSLFVDFGNIMNILLSQR